MGVCVNVILCSLCLCPQIAEVVGGEVLTIPLLAQLRYCEAMVMEVLRLYPSVPGCGGAYAMGVHDVRCPNLFA